MEVVQQEIINREWFNNRCSLPQIPETIDGWVEQYVQENRPPGPPGTLTLLREPPVIEAVPNPPPEGLVVAPRVQFQIYNTPPNGTCMIDSLLMVCSETYRGLNYNILDKVGIEFRKSVFKNIVMCYYLHAKLGDGLVPLLDVNGTPVQDRFAYLTGEIDTPTTYLEAQYLLPICYFYGINILVYTQSEQRPREWSLRMYPDDARLSDEVYIIHYNGVNHFSGMSCRVGDAVEGSFTIPYDIGNAIKENRIAQVPQLREEEQLRARARANRPPTSSSFSPSFGPLVGRAGTLEAYPGDENRLVLETELKPLEQQEAKPKPDPTLKALQELQKNAEAKLKKLEFVQWFFESGVPLDCENLQKGKLDANINKRLGEFQRLNLVDKLYEGLRGMDNRDRKSVV